MRANKFWSQIYLLLWFKFLSVWEAHLATFAPWRENVIFEIKHTGSRKDAKAAKLRSFKNLKKNKVFMPLFFSFLMILLHFSQITGIIL
jgi:hypothetical protein